MILKKIISRFSEINNNNALVILGGSFVGALAYTFSDSFWFNAVEAEVYAMATLFISLMFWLGLKWEEDMDTPRGNKWLLIICLVTGLSFGVHFMALLTIPSIGFLYYFKHYKTITISNFIVANVVVVAVLLFIFKLLLPWTMAFFGKTEIFAVNSLGLPFDSGTVLATLLIVAFFYFGLRYTRKNGYVFYNTIILCILFIFIGFSTWMMLPIRANANTPINENKPSDAAEVLAYYNREQYGVNPLFTARNTPILLSAWTKTRHTSTKRPIMKGTTKPANTSSPTTTKMQSKTLMTTKSHLATFVEYRTHRKLHQFYACP
jgi:hypothetical protein